MTLLFGAAGGAFLALAVMCMARGAKSAALLAAVLGVLNLIAGWRTNLIPWLVPAIAVISAGTAWWFALATVRARRAGHTPGT